MSHSHRHEKMFRERRDGVPETERYQNTGRYGNRRHELARMKVKERRAAKRNVKIDEDSSAKPDRRAIYQWC